MKHQGIEEGRYEGERKRRRQAAKLALKDTVGIDVADAPAPPAVKPSPLARLLQAKAESDRRNYGAKVELLRSLVNDRPTEFMVDSQQAGMAGITHTPTNFRIHMPRKALPLSLASTLNS